MTYQSYPFKATSILVKSSPLKKMQFLIVLNTYANTHICNIYVSGLQNDNTVRNQRADVMF